LNPVSSKGNKKRIGVNEAMDVRTYRARSLQEALRLIREDLGPDAAVLHTRELSAGMLGGLFGGRQIEVTASTEVNVPSRLPAHVQATSPSAAKITTKENVSTPLPVEANLATEFKARVRNNLAKAPSPPALQQPAVSEKVASTAELFHCFTDLIDSGMSEKGARELLDNVKRRLAPADWNDRLLVQSNLTRLVEDALRVRGAIQATAGRCKKIALVGPTGVGKTTTIAKLAANFRLKEKIRVGLITVDTYRIAAVEQLRTYAEIIDLPMEVVATPREMRNAVQRFAELDMVFIDTAGRSSRDASQIQELRSLLAESHADEVHLVLSSVTSLETQLRSAERFAAVGASHLILTKIDEAFGLGSLLPFFQHCELPLTYLTDGQNVPHDIRPAERRAFAQLLLGWEQATSRGGALAGSISANH
jgi:flagellar biosynthesis protein FlhF